MKHFSIAEWTDYAHGLIGSDVAVQMKAHLDTGCSRCLTTVRTLEKLVSVIAADNSRDVPQYVLHNAKSIFALHRPEKETVASVIARLVYDSFRQPLPAGVRNQQRVGRHAVYQAGDFCVDLRLDREDKSGRISLVGQLGRKAPAKAIGDVRVSLMAGKRVIAQATSNQYGEFHFEYEPTQHLRLHVPMDAGGKSFEISLSELSMPGSGRGDDVLGDEKLTNN